MRLFIVAGMRRWFAILMVAVVAACGLVLVWVGLHKRHVAQPAAAQTREGESAGAWVDEAVGYARQVQDGRKQERDMFEAAMLYVEIDRGAEGLKLNEKLPTAFQWQVHVAEVIHQARTDPEGAMKALSNLPEKYRDQACISMRTIFIDRGRLDLLRQTISQATLDYGKSLGIGRLSEYLVTQKKYDEALTEAAAISDAEVRKEAQARAVVAQLLDAGSGDVAAAAAAKGIVQPDLDRGLRDVADMRIEAGDLEQGRQLALQIKRAEDRINTFRSLASAQAKRGKLAEARATLDEAEKWLPDTEPVYRDLARLGLLTGRVEAGQGDAIIAQIRAMPVEEQPEFYIVLLNALVKTGRVQEAVDLVKADSGTDRFMYSFARVLVEAGRFRELRELRGGLKSAEEQASLCLTVAEYLAAKRERDFRDGGQ